MTFKRKWMLNKSNAICTLKALKGEDVELKIRWTDFLSGKNGTIVKYISVEEISVTPTITPTQSMLCEAVSIFIDRIDRHRIKKILK